MTTALKNDLQKINNLSLSEQNAIAEQRSEELVWRKSFESSQKQLSGLASEVLEEYKKGKTRPMNLK